MHKAIALAGALLIHFAVMLAALSPSCTQAVPPKKHTPPAEQGEKVLQIKLLPSDETESETPCADSYTGIGVNHSSTTITEVAPGGPADRAGIKAGDIFINEAEFWINQHPAGTLVVMRILRDGRELEFRLKIGRICYSQGE